jgi:DNA-binding transcriptional LysR family regulator
LGVLADGVAAVNIRQGRLSGKLQLGAIATVRADYLPALVLDYRKRRGNLIELCIEQGSTQELVQGLLGGKLELAIASTVDDPRISFTKLFDRSMGVIVQQTHPLADHASVSLAELRKYEVFTYRPDIPIGARLDLFLRANGLEPSSMHLNRDSDDEVMLGGIVSREPVVGLCLLTSSLLPYRNLKVIPLRETAARDIYSIGVLRVADSRLSPVAKDFLAHMEQFPAPSPLLP